MLQIINLFVFRKSLIKVPGIYEKVFSKSLIKNEVLQFSFKLIQNNASTNLMYVI